MLAQPTSRASDRKFVGRMIPEISQFFKAGPARVAVTVMTPIWRMRGLEGDALQDRQQDLYERTRLGAFPVGLTAFSAVVLLAVLFAFATTD